MPDPTQPGLVAAAQQPDSTAAPVTLERLTESLPRTGTYSFLEVSLTSATLGRVEPRTFLAAEQLPSDSDHLFLTLTARNASSTDTVNWPPNPFRLRAGAELVGPPEVLVGRPNIGLGPLRSAEMVLAFDVPSNVRPEQMQLVVAEEGRVPMTLPLTGPIGPQPVAIELPVGAEGAAQGRGVGCRQSLDVTVLGATISVDLLDTRFPTDYGSRRANEGERFLSVDLRVLNHGGSRCGAGATNFGNSDVVLQVDGVPRAPVTWVNVGIGVEVAEDLQFDFAVPIDAETLELHVGSAEATLLAVPLDEMVEALQSE